MYYLWIHELYAFYNWNKLRSWIDMSAVNKNVLMVHPFHVIFTAFWLDHFKWNGEASCNRICPRISWEQAHNRQSNPAWLFAFSHGRKIDFKAQQIWFVRDPGPNFSIKEESQKKFHTLSGQNSLKKARSNSFSCIRFSSSFNFLNILDNVFDFFRVFVARFCSFSFGVGLITGFCFFSAPMPRLSCFTCVSMGCNLLCGSQSSTFCPPAFFQ